MQTPHSHLFSARGSAWLCLTLMAAHGCTGALGEIQEADHAIGDRQAELSKLGENVGETDANITTEILAPWVGKLAPLPDQDAAGFYGADLGHVIKHRDAIRVIFGDSCLDTFCFPLSTYSDDSTASVSLQAFPDGAAMERFYAAQVPASGARTWQNTVAPPLDFRRTAFGRVKPTELYRDGALLDLGLLRAALTAFSNADDGLFVLFDRNVALKCSDSCPDGLSCDLEARSCASSFGELSACTESTDDCRCAQSPATGLCIDRGTSVYADNEAGRFMSVAHQLDVAVEDPTNPGTFRSQPWVTQRFINSTTRTVNDFDPTRPRGDGNDYTTPTALEAATPARQRVLMWGRGGYLGMKSVGLDAKLYFAYADMPRYDPQGHFAWQPKFFTGMNEEVPQFSAREADAVPLDLSGGSGDTTEPNDVVFVGSVAYVPSLQRWVMFYGGGLLGKGLQHWAGSLASAVQPNANGSVFARFAEQPWGPWSKPSVVFSPGDPTTTPPVVGSQYAAGGILHHPDCRGAGCVPGEPFIAPGEAGYMYAPYIQDPWTVAREPGKADIYWNLSSMVPYGIVTMRSTLELVGR